MEREAGYYWVRFSEADWMILYWSGDTFLYDGEIIYSKLLEEIDENRINREISTNKKYKYMNEIELVADDTHKVENAPEKINKYLVFNGIKEKVILAANVEINIRGEYTFTDELGETVGHFTPDYSFIRL